MSFFPTAPKRPYPITQHGETRIDNYYWLRDRQDPEVMKYLRAESDYLEEVMGHTKPLQEMLFAEMKSRIKETDSTVPEKRGEYYYYIRTEEGKQYPIFCRKYKSLENPEEILLDQNLLAEGKSFCNVGAFTVSPDGNKLAYSVDFEGMEIYTLYFKNLANETVYPEAIENTFSSVYFHAGVEWANDSETVFYLTFDNTQRAYRFWKHRIGTNPLQDTIIFEEEDGSYYLFIQKTRDDAYIIVNDYGPAATEIRFLSASQPDGELKVLSPRKEGIEYYVSHHEGYFYIITNEQAKNFKLMKAKIENLNIESWESVIPHREDTLIDYVDTFKHFLVLYERQNGLRQICVTSLDTKNNTHCVHFPEPIYSVETETNCEFDTNVLRFRYSSPITPQSIIDYHMDTRQWELVKQIDVVSGYDKSQYITERIYATALDGHQIPMSIVYKQDLNKNGGNPTLLYGYGSYGAVIDADFHSDRLSLLDRGFVFAIAHIRGGSELGRQWYESGKLLNKKNSFNDFISCAEHLIEEGYTTNKKLAIVGRSAGGLLVSACLTMRPDLFQAVINKVPFVDVITTMSDPTIPMTTFEYEEWGNPDNYEHYKYMLSYSPYDNIRATEYPHMLISTGLNDPRVAYWEPAKFAAKLREMKTDNNLLLLQTNYSSGHAGSSGRYDYLKEVAVDYAFLIDRLCGQVLTPIELQEATNVIRQDLSVIPER